MGQRDEDKLCRPHFLLTRNICTIEGVTCRSSDVDLGDYPIIDGKLRTSQAPGFGMKLHNWELI